MATGCGHTVEQKLPQFAGQGMQLRALQLAKIGRTANGFQQWVRLIRHFFKYVLQCVSSRD
jgi:hypothetical protein